MRPFLCGYILALSLLCGVAAHGGTLADCAGKISTEYLAARIQYQNKLRDFVVSGKPELETLASLNRDLQVAMAEERHAKLQYLLKYYPKRLVTSEGMAKFSNFDWTETEQRKFIQADRKNKTLAVNLSELKEKNNSHPGWPKMRAYFREELVTKPDYQNIQNELFAQIDDLGKRLKKCSKGL